MFAASDSEMLIAKIALGGLAVVFFLRFIN